MSTERKLVLDFLKLYSVKTADGRTLFDLSSGEQSSIYLDLKKTTLHNKIHVPLASLLCDAILEFAPITFVAGVALGGCHLASITSIYSVLIFNRPLDTVYIREEPKNHGTKQVIESPLQVIESPFTVYGGSSVILLEDVVTTGNSAFKAAEILREANFDVRGIICVVDRREKYDEYLRGQIPIRSLFKLEDLLT